MSEVILPCIQNDYIDSLYSIERVILEHHTKIETWFRQQWLKYPAPIYSSVDVRNSGFKIAPIDTNLFPAGFNNLHLSAIALAVQALQTTLMQRFPNCLRILIIPENHTRNLFYFESLAVLYTILQQAGYEVRIGSLIQDLKDDFIVNLKSGEQLVLEPLIRQGNRLGVKDFDSCVILLNHDLSEGIPELLQNIEQIILPCMDLGWHKRLKSTHFNYYAQVAHEFAAVLNLDPWFIIPAFEVCDALDFMTGEGVKELEKKAIKLFEQMEQAYKQREIAKSPYLVIKADAGTYGMGVMTIRDPKELLELNRKERTRMAATKGGQKISQVILQEGIYTAETVENKGTAEPVVYMIGQHVIGGFYRIHQAKGFDENLNAPGMQFEPLSFNAPCHCPVLNEKLDCQQNRFYTYGVIARLAALAAGYEIKTVCNPQISVR